MSTWAEVRGALWPRREDPDGLLPPLFLTLTIVTGIVDATSYLTFGHVFVANMTGNVVFLGFAFAGAGGFSIPTSLVAIAAFLLGSTLGGRIAARSPQRERLMVAASAGETAFLAGALVLSLLTGTHIDTASRYCLIALLAIAMGVQNAAARKAAVSDLTTTVLTLTLTGVAADSSLLGGPGSRSGRRILSVLAMLLGALVGALLVLKLDTAAPLGLATALLAVVFCALVALGRGAGGEN